MLSPGAYHVRIADCLDLFDAVPLAAKAESGEDILKKLDNCLCGAAASHLGETNNIGKRHADIGTLFDGIRISRLHTRHDPCRHDAEKKRLPLFLSHVPENLHGMAVQRDT